MGTHGNRGDGVRLPGGQIRPVPEDCRSLACRGDRQAVSLPRADFGGAVGVVLIIAGTVMVALAAVRFAHTRRAIDSANPSTDTVGADLALAAMMAVLGLALVLYLVHTLLNGI
jgi:hypothetical protein